MGMDVYGKNPTTEAGKYFQNSVWTWRPLADYVQAIAPDVCAKCKHWHTNDGAGLNAKDSLTLAAKLQAEVDAGRTAAYEKQYSSAQAMTPNVTCDLCEGTGTRKPVPHRGAGDTITGIRCNACNGEGTVRPYSTFYPFSQDNVIEFIAFLRECGGFEIL